jgi:hypothetical protein
LCFEQISTSGDAAVYFGKDDYGVDVKFFGATASSYGLWDQSADKHILYSANLNFGGTVGTPKGLLDVDAAASYFADFAATAKGGLVLTADGMSQDPETASEDGFIRILAGASIYEIPIYLNT